VSLPKDNTSAGWVKVYRDLFTHWISTDAAYLGAWVYFLHKANWKDKEWRCGSKIIIIKRGSFISSELKVAKELNISRGKIRAICAAMCAANMLTTEHTATHTTFTVCNYDKYQGNKEVSQTSQPTQQPTEDTTSNQQLVQPPITTKEIKKEKKERITLPFPNSDSLIRFTQAQIDYFKTNWQESEFRYWVKTLADWAEEQPSKFKKKTDHGRTINNWRRRELAKGVRWYEHADNGAGYYRTYDVERWVKAELEGMN
jgi:hypothetical protein